MFEKKDYWMMGAAVTALIALIVYRQVRFSKSAVVLTSGAEAARTLWSAWFLIVSGLLLLIALAAWLAARTLRKTRVLKYQAEIDHQVASGPTVFLLPRSDAPPVLPAKIDLWARLADALPHDEHLAFELSGSETQVNFDIHGSENGVRAALTQIRAEWPGVQQRPIQPADDPARLPEGWHLFWCECAPATWNKPISSLSDDPLRAVLIEMKSVVGQGQGLLQVIARNDFGTRKQLGQAAFAVRADKPDNAGVRAIRSREAKELEDRAQQTFLQATIRTVGMADTPERAQGIARGLARAVSASFGHSNPVRVSAEGQADAPVLTRQMGHVGVWADNELATLGHLVGKDMLFTVPRLQVASAKSLPAAPVMRIIATDKVAQFAQKETPGMLLPGARS